MMAQEVNCGQVLEHLMFQKAMIEDDGKESRLNTYMRMSNTRPSSVTPATARASPAMVEVEALVEGTISPIGVSYPL